MMLRRQGEMAWILTYLWEYKGKEVTRAVPNAKAGATLRVEPELRIERERKPGAAQFLVCACPSGGAYAIRALQSKCRRPRKSALRR